MSLDSRKENPSLPQIEERLARLEQMLGIVIEAQTNAVAAINAATQNVSAIDTEAATIHIRHSLTAVSKMYPKERTVIFSGREYFGDNIKYAFLSFVNRAKECGIACWFMTNDEQQWKQVSDAGLPCLPWSLPDWTAEHVRILLSAKVVVLCNVFCSRKGCGYFPYSLLQGAQFVQLWHGIPLKQIGLECLYAPRFYNQDVAESLAASGPFDAFVGGSAATREEWARRFVFRNYAPIGWPRTDVFFREPTPHDLINVDMEIFHAVKAASNAGRRVILYAPTFHEHKLGVWLEDANIEAMAARCAAKDWMLCVNLHPMEGGWVQQYRRRWPQVRFVAPQTDIYPIVRYASALVTDYSSLAFDYLLLDRPIVFYRPDHEEYVKYSRNLISNADDYTCGAVTENLFDLMQALTDTLSEQDPHRAARVALRQKLYDFTDGRAGERLNRLIMEHVEAKAQASALRP